MIQTELAPRLIMMERTQLTLCSLALMLCAPLAAQWAQIAAPTTPPARYYGGTTFDGIRGNTVVFGGAQASPGFRNDMWSFDGTDWTQLNPATLPSPRGHFQMVHDPVRDRIVMFGGRGGTGFNGQLLNETWEFDGTTWAQIATANTPAARQWFGMTYDAGRGVMVLYGGQAAGLLLDSDETWEYDGINWSLRTPTVKPGPLENAAMCYHSLLGRVILFSGIDVQVGGTSSTWAWDGFNWSQLSIQGAVPAPRTFARLAYDDSRQAALLFGGMDPQNGTLFTDMWEFDGVAWRQLPASGPVGRRGFGYVYDSLRQRTVLHGGLNQSFQGVTDTWMFGPESSTFGQSCVGSATTPSLAASTQPRVGRTFVASIGGLLPFAPVAVIATGFSSTNWNGTPLPLAMDTFGMPGCALFVSPDMAATLPASNGVANYALTIPADPWFVGQKFYQQGFSFEVPGFNAFGGTLSNATAMTIGW